MPNTTSYSFADVVLVAFPFTDQRRTKQRPAVVISSTGYNQNRPDVILMAITSQLREPPAFGEARIKDWRSAGLLKISAVKPVVFTAEISIIKKTLGQLTADDQTTLKAAVTQIISV